MSARISLLDENFSILDFCPESIRDDPEVIALSHAIDPEMRAVSAAIIECAIWPRIADVPEEVLDAIAYDMRLAELGLWGTASVAGKRAILTNVFDVRRRSGTVYAVRRIFDLLRLTATIVEWYDEGADPFTYRIVLDASEEGVTLEQLVQIPLLLRRFAPTRAELSSTTIETGSGGAVYLLPALTMGVLIEVGYA